MYINKYSGYFYKIPLIIQTMPETKNRSHWNSFIIDYFLEISELNIYPKKGWNRMYNLLFFLNYLIFIIIFIIFIFIIYFLYKISIKKIK